MLVSDNPELQTKIKELQNSFIEFALEEESSVKNWHIKQCINSIQRCLKRMDKCKTPKQALRNIARTVVTLNVINKVAKYDLIYTTEREEIAEILNEAATIKGLNPLQEDLTEDFRTW